MPARAAEAFSTSGFYPGHSTEFSAQRRCAEATADFDRVDIGERSPSPFRFGGSTSDDFSFTPARTRPLQIGRSPLFTSLPPAHTYWVDSFNQTPGLHRLPARIFQKLSAQTSRWRLHPQTLQVPHLVAAGCSECSDSHPSFLPLHASNKPSVQLRAPSPPNPRTSRPIQSAICAPNLHLRYRYRSI